MKVTKEIGTAHLFECIYCGSLRRYGIEDGTKPEISFRPSLRCLECEKNRQHEFAGTQEVPWIEYLQGEL